MWFKFFLNWLEIYLFTELMLSFVSPTFLSYMWIYVKVCEKSVQVEDLRSLLTQESFATQIGMLWFNASPLSCVPQFPGNKRLNIYIWGHQEMCCINELLPPKFPNKGEGHIAYELLFPNIVMNYPEVQNECAFREANMI